MKKDIVGINNKEEIEEIISILIKFVGDKVKVWNLG